MLNQARRLKKLESARVDGSGLIPHSDAWYAFYEEKLRRFIDGEERLTIRIPLEVIDRLASEA